MNEFSDCDFIVDKDKNEREYPVPQLTGWETVVFELQDETLTGTANL